MPILDRVLIDVNVILDYFNRVRRRKYPFSVEFVEFVLKNDEITKFISSSSLDNIAFIKNKELKEAYPKMPREKRKRIIKHMIEFCLRNFKIAKTPSYVEVDFDDIEDSLIIASAKAMNAVVVTRDYKLLKKHPELTMSPEEFLGKFKESKKTTIPMLNIPLEIVEIYPGVEKAIDDVLAKGNFILGDEVKQLEEKIANYVGTKYAVGVSSGTDALVLSLRALAIQRKKKEFFDKEDLIITTPFTFTATGEAILRAGATPLFVDIDPDTYNIDPEQVERAIKEYGSRVKGILPVHLYGQPCNMDEIMRIAKEYGLFVVEDCAQSLGAKWDGKQTGSFGDTGCFSFFPTKPLGGFGDGGMITTNDEELYELLLMLRKHGGKDKYNVEYIGYNARLDTVQAAVLLVKLEYLDQFNERRRQVAKFYDQYLEDIRWIKAPFVHPKAYHVYHQYTIRVLNGKRDEVQKKLKEKGIQTMVYYPVPLHRMKVFKGRCECFGKRHTLLFTEEAVEQVLSLPIEPIYGEEVYKQVIEEIKSLTTLYPARKVRER